MFATYLVGSHGVSARMYVAITARPDVAASAPVITSSTGCRVYWSSKYTRNIQVGGANAGTEFATKMARKTTTYCVT